MRRRCPTYLRLRIARLKNRRRSKGKVKVSMESPQETDQVHLDFDDQSPLYSSKLAKFALPVSPTSLYCDQIAAASHKDCFYHSIVIICLQQNTQGA